MSALVETPAYRAVRDLVLQVEEVVAGAALDGGGGELAELEATTLAIAAAVLVGLRAGGWRLRRAAGDLERLRGQAWDLFATGALEPRYYDGLMAETASCLRELRALRIADPQPG